MSSRIWARRRAAWGGEGCLGITGGGNANLRTRQRPGEKGGLTNKKKDYFITYKWRVREHEKFKAWLSNSLGQWVPMDSLFIHFHSRQQSQGNICDPCIQDGEHCIWNASIFNFNFPQPVALVTVHEFLLKPCRDWWIGWPGRWCICPPPGRNTFTWRREAQPRAHRGCVLLPFSYGSHPTSPELPCDHHSSQHPAPPWTSSLLLLMLTLTDTGCLRPGPMHTYPSSSWQGSTAAS